MTNYLSILVLLFSLRQSEEEGLVTPIIQTQECTFAYVKTNNLYLVSTTKKNANIGKAMEFHTPGSALYTQNLLHSFQL
jgi:hypothetical protein